MNSEIICTFDCGVCEAKFSTLYQHAHHQKLHANNRHFNYQCGVSTCVGAFQSFRNLASHISKCHKKRTSAPVSYSSGLKCIYCGEVFVNKKNLCLHLKDVHVANGENVTCPFQDVYGRELPLCSRNVFSKHMSQYHPSWREEVQELNFHISHDDDIESEDEQWSDAVRGFEESKDEDMFYDALSSIDYDENNIFEYLGKFYIMLETECFLPVATIDKISENLTYVSEMSLCHMKNNLIPELKSRGISDEDVGNILCKMVDSNPLYLAHHKYLRGPSFSSEHMRRVYFEEHFISVPSQTVNLSKDPVSPEPYEYIPIRKTLTVLLSDPSVQKEVLLFFHRFANSSGNTNVYRDYTDGSVCKGRSLPSKRIDLILFQDGYSATGMMTTVRNRHKCLGAYVTLGNIRSEFRTKLKSMQLVLMILEEHVKKYRQKCFKKLQEELKDLDENGIEFMGEIVPVFLQFFVGDNLGSHFLAGFLESFTAVYPCRFCLITTQEYKRDPCAVKPFRTQEQYNLSVSILNLNRALRSHEGVKEDCVLNKLNHFKVCDPGFPPCLGHDLFHGVVDWDLAEILKYFVDEDWFSYTRLNRRINEFKYQTADLKNKPAPVTCTEKGKGKKLGGSAVQNWTLLRLLPSILESLIKNPAHEVWNLYLLLKTICELICAPAITEDQISKLDQLICLYLSERNRLFPLKKVKPKHHYFRHYACLIRAMGPLIFLWGMRFEQKHQFFKRIARACNNFINLIRTLVTRHQLFFSLESSRIRYHDTVSKCVSYPFRPGYFNEEISALIAGLDLPTHAEAASSLKIKNVTFKEGGYLLFYEEVKDIYVGYIEGIILDKETVFFICRKLKASLNENHGVYEIAEDGGELVVKDLNSLDNMCPIPVYSFEGTENFSLKHSLLPVMPSL